MHIIHAIDQAISDSTGGCVEAACGKIVQPLNRVDATHGLCVSCAVTYAWFALGGDYIAEHGDRRPPHPLLGPRRPCRHQHRTRTSSVELTLDDFADEHEGPYDDGAPGDGDDAGSDALHA